MIKVVIVYESMFGNTRQVAEAIRDGMSKVALVSVLNVNDVTPVILENSDVAIVGAPTHAHTLSRASTRAEAAHLAEDRTKGLTLEPGSQGIGIREWLDTDPHGPQYFAAFDTRTDIPRLLSGAASARIDRSLTHLGLTRVATAESFLVDPQNRLDEGERQRAREWGTQIERLAEQQVRARRGVQFTAALHTDGKTATGLHVPDETIEALGGGKRIAVAVTINAVTYPSTIAVYKGRASIPVSAEIRERAGVRAGDVLTVQVELDDAPRTVEVPDDLQAALDGEAAAAARFATLSFSNQRRHVLAVTGARTEETRARRIAHVLEELGA